MNLLLSATILIILLLLFRYNTQRETFEVNMGAGDDDAIDYLPEDCVDGCTVYCDKPEGCKGVGHMNLRPHTNASRTARSEIIINTINYAKLNPRERKKTKWQPIIDAVRENEADGLTWIKEKDKFLNYMCDETQDTFRFFKLRDILSKNLGTPLEESATTEYDWIPSEKSTSVYGSLKSTKEALGFQSGLNGPFDGGVTKKQCNKALLDLEKNAELKD